MSKVRNKDGSKTTASKQAAQALGNLEADSINISGGAGADLSGFRGNNGKVYGSAWLAITNNSGPPAYKGGYALNIATGEKWKYDYDKDLKTGKIVKYARGGTINELIYGLGQRTGNRYMFGESGPETITPGVGTKQLGGGNTTIHITINNPKDSNEIYRNLKPVILKILKESTARTGIV